jgi:hypothetical protein
MFNYLDHLFYMFIPVSGCVGRSPTLLFCPGAYNAVKTTLHYMYISIEKYKALLMPSFEVEDL